MQVDHELEEFHEDSEACAACMVIALLSFATWHCCRGATDSSLMGRHSFEGLPSRFHSVKIVTVSFSDRLQRQCLMTVRPSSLLRDDVCYCSSLEQTASPNHE